MLAALALLAPLGATCAGPSTLEVGEADPPAAVHAVVSARLAPRAFTRCSGGAALAIVWVAERAAIAERAPSRVSPLSAPRRYPDLAPGELLGALTLRVPAIDARGQQLAPGDYTLRYAVQPVSKEHMGTAVFGDFALLLPAAVDDGTATDMLALIEASRAASARGHPLVLEMTATSTGQPAPQVVELSWATRRFGLRLVVERPDEP